MPGSLISSLSSFLLLILFPLISNSASEDDGVVFTTSGPIKGKHLPAGSGSVAAYLGIPYAEPPVGKLRFQKPVPHQPWGQVLEATRFGNACPQFIYLDYLDVAMWVANQPLSEDCLFLNIWKPYPYLVNPYADPAPPPAPPVLVWLHGGDAFLTGTSSLDMFNGAALAHDENVIVVTLNYRLGALGFLSLPPAVPGNMGLMDQQLALKWVKENAAAFGGDPTRVTIFGHDSGAASVGLHLLSPSSRPLFAQAILQSGSPYAAWGWRSPEEAEEKAIAFSQLLGCPKGNDSVMVSCLQEKNAAEFGQHELFMAENDDLDVPFIPTTDGEFLPQSPQKLLDAGYVLPDEHKPILIGVTSDEASTFVPYLFPNASDGLITWEQLLKAVEKIVPHKIEEEVQAVARRYSEKGSEPGRYRWAMSQSFSDYFFVCPVAEFAAKVSKAGNPVYFYIFGHHTSGSVWPEWIGAPHDAEIPYAFGTLKSAVGVNQTYTEAEAALSRRMMRYWAEFSRTGNPTGSEFDEVKWPLYNATWQKFFYLGTEPSEVTQISPFRTCGFLERHI